MERGLILLDRVQDQMSLNVVVEATEFKKRIHRVQCQDRWANGCLDRKCSAFQIVRGNYYCTQKRLCQRL